MAKYIVKAADDSLGLVDLEGEMPSGQYWPALDGDYDISDIDIVDNVPVINQERKTARLAAVAGTDAIQAVADAAQVSAKDRLMTAIETGIDSASSLSDVKQLLKDLATIVSKMA